MWFGKDYFYQCTKCDNLIVKGSLLSGNTLGEEIYSDGFSYAPMLEQFPEISRCGKCGTIVWLHEENEVEYEEGGNYTDAKFLSIRDYLEALENEENKIVEKEIIIRRYMLWLFNHDDRSTKYHNNESSGTSREHNVKRLIEILDHENFEHQLLLVELYRYLGDFEKSKKLIGDIYIPDLELYAQKAYKEIENKKTKVFRLK